MIAALVSVGMMMAASSAVAAEAGPVVSSVAAPGWLTVTWVALVSAVALGVALRLSIGALAALRLITRQAAQQARAHARVLIGALVLIAMVFPYVVRQQPALALLLLLGMGALAASDIGQAAPERPSPAPDDAS